LPAFNGTIYLSYKKINQNLPDLIEDSRNLAYKHSIKADAIDESLIRDPERNVYGIIYDLKGNTASSIQFFVSDSTNHFLRGSLYFNTQPDKDSLAPVIRFVREDVIHLINTIKWN
jgi:gliding motility-associated lipoprotein GldD